MSLASGGTARCGRKSRSRRSLFPSEQLLSRSMPENRPSCNRPRSQNGQTTPCVRVVFIARIAAIFPKLRSPHRWDQDLAANHRDSSRRGTSRRSQKTNRSAASEPISMNGNRQARVPYLVTEATDCESTAMLPPEVGRRKAYRHPA